MGARSAWIGARNGRGRRVEDLEIAQRVAVWVTDDDDETAPAGSSGPISRSTAPPPSIGTSLRGWAIRTRRRRSGRVSRSATGRASWPRCRTGRSSGCTSGAIGRPATAASGEFYAAGIDTVAGGAAGHQRRGLRRDLRGVPPRRLPRRRRGITVNPGAPPQVLTLRQLPKPDDEGSGLHGSTTGGSPARRVLAGPSRRPGRLSAERYTWSGIEHERFSA